MRTTGNSEVLLFCVPTNKVRNLVGSFTRGMELPTAFSRLFTEHQVRSGHLHMTGQLDAVTVLTEARVTPLTINSPTLILHCEGFISDLDGKVETHLMCTLQFAGTLGPQTVGGLLVSARILSCEFRLAAFDDVFIVKKSDPKLLFPVWLDCFTENPTGIRGSANPDTEPEPDLPMLVPEQTPSEDAPQFPSAGDIVEHFKFGSCRVQKVDSGDMLDVWLPSKNKARLSMQVLQFEFIREDEDGTLYFHARPMKTR